ncbi:MAG TPA: VOC family protein [Steroidobacteraceae bacterium]|nr:VOC family protein [Steroidobacteraceae bacterium]
MLEGRHYQNAYITRDIDRAVESFRNRAGVRDARVFEAAVEVQTPAGRGMAVSKLAFIWIDDLQYELIEPVRGLVDIYRDALPADDSLKFHHICMRVGDWHDFRARVEARRSPVVLEGGSEQLRFLYIDARDFLGHYLEYTWMTPERWTQLGGR